MSKLNFVFWGTPEVASETLEILKENGYTPSLIVTAPDKPQGRKMIITPPPVKVWAIANNIPYVQPEKLTEPLSIFLSRGSHSEGEGRREEKLEEAKYDFFLVVAYGKIMPEEILNMPKLGSINVHYSLLPKYRGASPVESVILSGEAKTGVTIQKMKHEMDSGPILAKEEVQILSDENAPELRKRLIEVGGNLLVNNLQRFAEGKIKETPQNDQEATFCKKIKKEDGLIDLDGEGIKNYNKFRAYAHWPRTFFFKNGKRIIITDASLVDNKFIIKRVLPEGRKEINYADLQKLVF